MSQVFRTIHVGCGTRGAHHLRTLVRDPSWQPVALVDVVERYFDDAVAEHGLARRCCYPTLGQALRAVEADVAVISSPATTHAGLVMEALQAGLHVWVEKPFTCDLASARACVDLAESRGLRLMVGNQARFTPPQLAMRRALSARLVGQPGYATLIHHKVRPTPYNPSPHEQLWQMSVHHFDSIRAIFQAEVESICARSFAPPWSRYRQSAAVQALLVLRGGLTLNLLSSSDSRVPFFELRVECSQGALVQADYMSGEGIRLLRRDGEEVLPVEPPPNGWSVDEWQFHMLYDYLARGVEPETSGRKNLPTVAICDAAQRSSETGQVVHLSA